MLMTNIARIIGVIAAFLAGQIVTYASHHGLTLDPAELTTFITTTMIGAYALVHRLISKKTNEGDAATPEARREIKASTNQYRAQRQPDHDRM